MAKKIAQLTGLKEIPYWRHHLGLLPDHGAWLIKTESRTFIYVGSKTGLALAKDRVKESRSSRESGVTIQKIV